MNEVGERPERLTGKEAARGAMHRKGATEHVMFTFAVASVGLMLLLYVGLVFYGWLVW